MGTSNFAVQTRNEEGELMFFATLREAKAYADEAPAVWKISFALKSGERVRLVRDAGRWVLEQLEVG